MLDYKYAYLVGDLLLALIWSILFLIRKDLRKEILSLSILGGIAGIATEVFYLQDYWQPQLFNSWVIGFEDFLFGFFACGISATIYEEIFGKRFAKKKKFRTLWVLKPVPLLVLVVIVMSISVFGLGLSSMYTSFILFLVAFIIMIFLRRDLFINGFLSGIFMGILMVVCYLSLLAIFPDLINKFWFVENLSGIELWSIPLEELIWAFCLGMAVGPYWEFIKGYKLR